MKNVVRLLYVVGFFSLLTSCIPDSIPIDDSMVLETYKMSIYEPSGLCFTADEKDFFTVSDRGMLYKISQKGETIKQLPYEGKDFEGVTVDPDNYNIYLVKERSGELIKLDYNGNKLATYNIIGDSGNSGLEGVCYDADNEIFYLLKEKNDGLLIKFSISQGKLSETSLQFASDYSGIFFNKTTGSLWIVSDESKTLTKCTTNGVKIKSYKLPITGVEGVVVNNDETIAYVVSDPNNKLYKLNLIE
jgi:uncharacterized protein YjiK